LSSPFCSIALNYISLHTKEGWDGGNVFKICPDVAKLFGP